MNESHNWPAPDPIHAASTQSSWTAADMGQEQLASFGQRAIGRILDSLNVFVLYLGYVMLTALLLTGINADEDAPIAQGFAVLGVFAFVMLQIYWEGQGGTPFRRGYGAVIVDMNTGQPIGMPRAFLRIFVANISLLAFGLGFLWMLWDPKKQTWHDKAARTSVVKR
jgi:uncharacterized RDD family membrane protein YckC